MIGMPLLLLGHADSWQYWQTVPSLCLPDSGRLMGLVLNFLLPRYGFSARFWTRWRTAMESR